MKGKVTVPGSNRERVVPCTRSMATLQQGTPRLSLSLSHTHKHTHIPHSHVHSHSLTLSLSPSLPLETRVRFDSFVFSSLMNTPRLISYERGTPVAPLILVAAP